MDRNNCNGSAFMISSGVVQPDDSERNRPKSSVKLEKYAKIGKNIRNLATLSLCAGSACFGAAAGNVTLGWDRNPAQNITGYIVYYGTASGFYTAAIDVGNNTTQTISGLVEGKVYYFVVSAYNSARLESNF